MSFSWPSDTDSPLLADDVARIVLVQAVWMFVALVMLLLSSEFTPENYFIISFIGLIAVSQVFAPADTRTRWWSILRIITFAGYAIFALIIYRRVSEVAVLI